MNKVLITGAKGFIGSSLYSRLTPCNKVIGVDITDSTYEANNNVWERIDLTDRNSVAAICEKHAPDLVIHCAGIAHQKIGSVDLATYLRVNSETTENLAIAAANANPEEKFIFLSTISVYGEENVSIPVSEKDIYHPSSDYAISKLDAEKRLISLYNTKKIKNLTILRLAPVYDRYWSLNLDRRVLLPLKLSFLKYGSGQQKMSALARPNLVDFINYLLDKTDKHKGLEIMNLCDENPYTFNQIIKIFKTDNNHPKRPVISIPLPFIWYLTRFVGLLLPKKKKWLHSGYEKLKSDLVFDNSRMLKTGFLPKHSLETIFSSTSLRKKL